MLHTLAMKTKSKYTRQSRRLRSRRQSRAWDSFSDNRKSSHSQRWKRSGCAGAGHVERNVIVSLIWWRKVAQRAWNSQRIWNIEWRRGRRRTPRSDSSSSDLVQADMQNYNCKGGPGVVKEDWGCEATEEKRNTRQSFKRAYLFKYPTSFFLFPSILVLIWEKESKHLLWSKLSISIIFSNTGAIKKMFSENKVQSKKLNHLPEYPTQHVWGEGNICRPLL